jgi:ankyrin repeat protein
VADPLLDALRAGDEAAVRNALKTDPGSATKPQVIVTAGRLAFQPGLKLLHRHGANLNAEWRGYRAMHSLIQEEPHDVSQRPSDGRIACLRWLVAHGADPDLPAAWPPARAIIIAAFAGRPDYTEVLRGVGARIDAFAAAALGDVAAVRDAIRARPGFFQDRDIGGLTALQCAAGTRLPGAPTHEIARILIEAGADVCAKTRSWRHDIDAVYLAASAKNTAVFELLLDSGADPTEALTPALWNGNVELAQAARARGANPDGAVADGQPLLNNLIRWGQFKPAFWLIEHGASPNIPDGRGWTAVHQAVSRGNVKCFRALIAAGGDFNLRDREGRTPVQLAREMGRSTLLA